MSWFSYALSLISICANIMAAAQGDSSNIESAFNRTGSVEFLKLKKVSFMQKSGKLKMLSRDTLSEKEVLFVQSSKGEYWDNQILTRDLETKVYDAFSIAYPLEESFVETIQCEKVGNHLVFFAEVEKHRRWNSNWGKGTSLEMNVMLFYIDAGYGYTKVFRNYKESQGTDIRTGSYTSETIEREIKIVNNLIEVIDFSTRKTNIYRIERNQLKLISSRKTLETN